MRKNDKFIWLLVLGLFCMACGDSKVTIMSTLDETPPIFPDYKEVTIPYNIAPLNFSYLGEENCRLLVEGAGGKWQIEGDNGLFAFSLSEWKQMMEQNKGKRLTLTVAIQKSNDWVGYRPFEISVASQPIDPYLSYRLIPPGYEGWKTMGLYQRNLETYEQTAIYENKLTDGNCVNCHSFCGGDPGKMLFHARAGHEGTIMIRDQKIEKLNTKTDATISAFVYPYWHPSGRYVAFSVNQTKQNFFNTHANRVEVYDTASDVVVYDVEEYKIAFSPLLKTDRSFETFPAFSPDGRNLYFCSAQAVDSLPQKSKDVKYDLCRINFNPDDMTFGNHVDTVYCASKQGKSASFPCISPDGRFLVFTLHAFGNFSIWHKDADLYRIDLQTNQVEPMTEANSDDVESYHSWSANSRWMVFGSRRTDGLYTQPFITYIDEAGKAHKPFLLPQKNPLKDYRRLMFSYNIPELLQKKVCVDKHALVRTMRESKGISINVKRLD